MIKISTKIPKDIYIAVSGGLDSMVILDFLRRSNSRNIEVLHFNHRTEHSDSAEALVRKLCEDLDLNLFVGEISTDKKKNESQEEYWRRERYSFFEKFNDKKIITCHHLNDQVETYIFTMLNGNEMLIPSKRGNFIRPFLLTKRADLESWAKDKCVIFADDPSNNDVKYSRNLIRHKIIPLVSKVNPGLEKIVMKKIMKSLL